MTNEKEIGAAFERGSDEWLAKWVLWDARKEAARMSNAQTSGLYYMLRPNNPALAKQLLEWRQANGIGTRPMSDFERTMWELEVIAPATKGAMVEYYKEVAERLAATRAAVAANAER